MRAIQRLLPDPRHTEVHRIFVAADPKRSWKAARHFNGASIPWVKMLFDLRVKAGMFKSGKVIPAMKSIGVDSIAENGKGLMVIHEQAGREVVIGAVGKFWHFDIPFAEIEPDEFREFRQPGWGKLAWSITVEPYKNGSSISFELRTTATDEISWGRLSAYYRFIGIFSHLIRTSVMSQLEDELGKMKFPDDDEIVYPGDHIIPDARHKIAYHKVIEAPVSLVWKYLMQLGCDRAGWYSIDMLDNDGKPSIDHLVKEWGKRSPGDKISATPSHDNFFEVYEVEKEKYITIGGETERMGGPFRMTWSFILEPIGADATHLISTARMSAAPKWTEWLMGNILYPPVHGLMSTVQLSNIKKIAERDAQMRKTPKKKHENKQKVAH